MTRAYAFFAALSTVTLGACSCSSASQTAAKKTTATPAAVSIALAWDSVSDASIEAYHVYALSPAADAGEPQVVASAAAPGDWKLVSEYAITEKGFDPKAPKAALTSDTATVLQTFAGKTTCFRITAFAKSGESPASNIACGAL